MKLKHSLLYGLTALALIFAVFLLVRPAKHVKEPTVAGAFYPTDEQALAGMVKDFLASAETTSVNGKLIALIVPHAGYQFSGQVAAYAYRHLMERNIDTVILIGPSHDAVVNGAAVYASGSMKTPLGNIRINEQIARSLVDEKAHITANPAAFKNEYSIEVQLPFLQGALKDFTIVPILIGQPSRDCFDSLTRSLTAVLGKNQNVILIASSDLSHYHSYEKAKRLDSRVADAVTRMSLEDLERQLHSGECEMCGGYPVLFTMSVARRLGATNGVVYKYGNSGDIMSDKSRVVGYAAMGLYRTQLTVEERNELLALAKRSIESQVKLGRTREYRLRNARLAANGATFVTINRDNDLRGCIGNIDPVMPLYESVIKNAVAACSRDSRFKPMKRAELKDMQVEVTVLSPLEPLQNVRDIKIGTHGIYLIKGPNSGILLPQVAVDFKWDVPTFLEQVSIKAGLPKDAWNSAQLYSFTAEVIK
jgi:AmmeMemoRadiSam system protein B/AmmeMemoRadiSam system protein A